MTALRPDQSRMAQACGHVTRLAPGALTALVRPKYKPHSARWANPALTYSVGADGSQRVGGGGNRPLYIIRFVGK